MHQNQPRNHHSLRGIAPILSVLFGLAASLAPVAAQEGRIAPNGLGFEVELGTDPSSIPDGEGLLLRVEAEWAQLEAQPGATDLKSLSALAGDVSRRGYRVALALHGGSGPYGSAFPTAETPEHRQGWLDLSQAVAREEVDLFEFPLPWAVGAEPADVSFLLKKTAVLVTGIRAGGKMVLSGIRADNLDTLETLLGEDISAYVDVYAIDGGAPGRSEARQRLESLLADADPGAEVWVHGLEAGPEGPGAGMIPGARALGEGFWAATVDPGESDLDRFVRGLNALSGALPAELAAVPGGSIEVLGKGNSPVPGAGSVTFFDAESLDTVIAWWGTEVRSAVVLALTTSDVGRPTLSDPLGVKEPGLLQFGKDNEARKAAVGVPMRPYPLMARFPREVSQDVEFEPMEVDVAGEEDMPVAEIIARHQRFLAEQEERMQHFVADERINLHYEISAGTTIDVGTDNVFFYQKGGHTEWREKDFFVNGVRWRWGDRPKLPLIQPEKVESVPLLITLGKEYAYEKKGRENIEGHDCYVVAFSPRDPERSFYSGRVWIDRDTFARIQMSVVQTALEPPVISNEETQIFRPVETADGTFWLTHRIEGQQIFSIGGSSTPVSREVEFSNFRVNGAEFEELRTAAYRSDDIMFRETEDGDRYLDPGEGGERVVNTTETKSSLLGAAGAFYQQDFDTVLPLLGVNYFSFDWLGTGSQFNLLFAGALVTATFNKPDLWGKNQLSADLIGIAIPITDTVYEGEIERPLQDVEILNEFVNVRLGVPFANFFRLNSAYSANLRKFSRADDTGENFTVPSDHIDHGLSLSLEMKRSGYRVVLNGEYHLRSEWEPWGRPGSQDWEPDDDSYVQASLSAAKDFYLPKFMRLHVDAAVQTGQQLDRFSKWRFGFFGNRVRGFAGSGVRYTDGAIARAYYGFNVGDVIRLDANFDYARVRDEEFSDEEQSFFGTGITATLMGPWKTIVNLDVGYGLSSDIPGLESEAEYRIVVFKIFK